MSGSAGDLSDRSVPELLELFASISQEIETVDHVGRVNRLHDTRRRVVAAIKDRSDGTVRALLPLVSHDDPHAVRWVPLFTTMKSSPTPVSGAARIGVA